MFTYLFNGFFWRVFSVLRADGLEGMGSSCPRYFPSSPVILVVVSIYLITSTTVPQIPVLVLHPEFGARFAPSVHDDLCSKNSFSLPLFPLTERRCHFHFRVLANHLASIFFLTLSGDSLGLLSLWPGHRVQTCVGFHSDLYLLLEELT